MPSTVETDVPDHAELNRRIIRLRATDNRTNLGYLALDYLCLVATIGGAIFFAERRGSWGISWWLNVPVFALAIVLIGALQHRLSGLAHEASHFSLLRNKYANDLVADLFCLFPIFSTLHFYRLFHLAHHQFTNDPERDPDLVNLGPGKRVEDFPMGRVQTIINVYLRAIVLPVSFARYQMEYIYVNSLGKGGNVLMRRVPGGDADSPWPRTGTLLGLGYLLAYNVVLLRLTATGNGGWIPAAAAVSLILAFAAMAVLPSSIDFRSPFRQPYSPRVASLYRLAFYTVGFAILAHIRWKTNGSSAIYPVLLWWVPLTSSFMFFMFLRDIYQHTNADEGRLTHSRVFFCDAFTRWAVLIHGQDMHIPHHLFPTVPHYRLRQLHDELKRSDRDYAAQVVECQGTFANGAGLPTILDVLTEPRPPQLEVLA